MPPLTVKGASCPIKGDKHGERPDSHTNENPCLQRNPTDNTAGVSFSTYASYKSPMGPIYIPNLVQASVAAVWSLIPLASKDYPGNFSAARWGTKPRPQSVSIKYDEATLSASTRSRSISAAPGERSGVLSWLDGDVGLLGGVCKFRRSSPKAGDGGAEWAPPFSAPST